VEKLGPTSLHIQRIHEPKAFLICRCGGFSVYPKVRRKAGIMLLTE